jgi:hypothetical protein
VTGLPAVTVWLAGWSEILGAVGWLLNPAALIIVKLSMVGNIYEEDLESGNDIDIAKLAPLL